MGDRDRLADLARLVARLRFAVEGDDRAQIDEAESDVRTLAKYLPAEYDVGALLAAAKDPTRLGGELAQLYLERCYKLTDKDDDSLLGLEERIRALQEREESGARRSASGDRGPVAQWQSGRLITGWSQVRTLAGPPFSTRKTAFTPIPAPPTSAVDRTVLRCAADAGISDSDFSFPSMYRSHTFLQLPPC